MSGLVEQANIPRQEKVVLELGSRAEADLHEASELRVPVATAALSDVCRDGSCRAAKLRSEAIRLLWNP